MTGHIYLISSKRNNGEIYVGSTKRLAARWRNHRQKLRDNKHHNIFLQRAYNKYGEADFCYLVAEECPEENLIVREQAWIDAFKSGGIPIFNMSPTTQPYDWSGRKHTSEARERMSIAQKKINKVLSEETRAKISIINKGNNYRLGMRHTKESIEKMRQAHSGKKHSVESRIKMSLARMGNTIRADWCRRKNELARETIPEVFGTNENDKETPILGKSSTVQDLSS